MFVFSSPFSRHLVTLALFTRGGGPRRNVQCVQKTTEREESESSGAQKPRETQKLQSLVLVVMVKAKQYQRNLCFWGCLFSPPLRQYIFHWFSTKRGRSIFYHKSLWTWSHVYSWTTRTRARARSPLLSLACTHARARSIWIVSIYEVGV